MAYSCGLPWMYFWHVNFCNFSKGERQWWYQVCTEVAYFQVAPAKGSIRSPGVNEKWASPTSQFLVKPSYIFQAHYETWVITNMYLFIYFFCFVIIAPSHCSWSLESSNPISPNHVTMFLSKIICEGLTLSCRSTPLKWAWLVQCQPCQPTPVPLICLLMDICTMWQIPSWPMRKCFWKRDISWSWHNKSLLWRIWNHWYATSLQPVLPSANSQTCEYVLHSIGFLLTRSKLVKATMNDNMSVMSFCSHQYLFHKRLSGPMAPCFKAEILTWW